MRWANALRRLIAGLTAIRPPLELGERVLRFDAPHVMGILNMTPDSFSDGGKLIGDPDKAADAGFAMQVAGVSIVDVGGEIHPARRAAGLGRRRDRARRAGHRAAREERCDRASADTRKAAVMEAALAAGAHIVNDVTGLRTIRARSRSSPQAGCPVILMHTPSAGEDPHGGAVTYKGDAVGGPTIDAVVFDWLEARIAACLAAGISTVEDHRRSGHRLRQGARGRYPHPQQPRPLPGLGCATAVRREPQAHGRRAVQRRTS